MKNAYALFLTSLVIFSSFSLFSQQNVIFRRMLDPNDVAELNKLGSAIGINDVQGWPVSSEEQDHIFLTIKYVSFIVTDTLERTEGNNRIITIVHKVESIQINDKSYSGILPALSFSDLKSLRLVRINISGSVPSFNFPLCTNISLIGNQLSGNIPNISLPNLLTLDLSHNNFTGAIPQFNLPKLVNLILSNNKLEGPIPALNLPNLKYFGASRNNLSGELPLLQMPQLETLELEENNLTSPLPMLNFPKAINIRLTSNKFSGAIPSFNMPELSNLALGENELSGLIPAFNLPKLILLNLKANKLVGGFDNSGLPKLDMLYLQDNNLSEIPHLKSTSPEIRGAQVQGNRLTFEHLKPNLDILWFYYNPQQRVKCYKTQEDNLNLFWVEVAGSGNLYQWYKVIENKSSKIEGAINKRLEVFFEQGASYWCRITNEAVPGLNLNSELASVESCITIGTFIFCLQDGKWENEQANKLISSGRVIINDLLTFEGTMSLDTVNLELKANGEFFFENIPLSDGVSGKYLISQGDHNLKLLGEDGVITNYINSKLLKTAEIFGTPLIIESLKLIKKQDTLGVKINCSINIPRLANSCGTFKTADIAVKDLEVTNYGISLGGFDVENIGFMMENYCLKKLSYSYDPKKDILTGGANVSFPFFENVGGGFKLEKGNFDSLAWNVELKKPAVPILYSFAVKGFYGHVAGLNYKPKFFGDPEIIDIRLGGIFGDILVEDLYKIKAEGRTIWPKLFELSGTGQFLKPPIKDVPFQFSGDVALSYDVPEKQINLGFNGNFGTLNETNWLMDVSGIFTLDYRTEKVNFTGNFGGDIKLPKLSNGFPFDWLATVVEFPVILGTSNSFFSDNTNWIHGVLYLKMFVNQTYNLAYIIDVTKYWYQDGYIRFPAKGERQVFVYVDTKSSNSTNNVTKTFIVNENSEFVVIEVKSPANAPNSILITPAGKEYKTSSPDDNMIFTVSADKKQAFWTAFTPQKGDWKITVENLGVNDSIIVYQELRKNEFKFSVNQTGQNININWDVALVDSGQTVKVMFDKDMEGFDGFFVAQGDAKSGNINFVLNETFSGCNYNIYAQLIDETGVSQSYSDKIIDNAFNSLSPPENFMAQYNSLSSTFNFSWTTNKSQDVRGYILTVTDNAGNDSVYAILDNDSSGISLLIDNFETKTAKIETYSLDWKIGCASDPVGLTTKISDYFYYNESVENFIVYPNPTSGKCSFRFSLNEGTICEIRVFDFTGRLISQPVKSHFPAGIHEKEWDFGALPNGMYFFVMRTSKDNFIVKSILSR